MAQISKTERILNLVSFLLKEREPVPWREICGKVIGYDDKSDMKSLERRFERDKAELKALGLPLRFYPEGRAEREGYAISREDCFLDPLELLPHESALLNLISELSVAKGDKNADLVTALQKLRFDAPDVDAGVAAPSGGASASGAAGAAGSANAAASGEASPSWSARLLKLDRPADDRQSPHLEPITEAIVTNRPISFTYYAVSSGETRERTIDPYGLGFVGGEWYVVGRDHLRDAVRQFKIGRIRGRVQPVGEAGAFRVPKGFKVADAIAAQPWLARDGHRPEEALQVRVLVGRDIAWFSFGPVASKAVEEREDGSAILDFDVLDETSFLTWALQHARHVRILEPAALRERFAAMLDDVAERHAPLALSSAPGAREEGGA